MLSRRRLLKWAGVGSALAYPTILEPQWLEVTHTTIPLPKNVSGRAVRVLHFADLHVSHFVSLSYIDSAIQLGLAQRPDIALITGDFITYRNGFDPDAYVESLAKLARSVPTYAVLGNHDGGVWAWLHSSGFQDTTVVQDILRRSGVKLLHNAAETVRVNNRDLRIVGVGDLWAPELDAQTAFAKCTDALPTLLLSHNPDSKEQLGGFPWHVMLCGHTHGGQVLIPFDGPRFAPVQDKRYVAGLKSWRDRRIYVTRGVGNLAGVRFRCRPELSLLTVL